MAISDDSEEGYLGGYTLSGHDLQEEDLPDWVSDLVAQVSAQGWQQVSWSGGHTLLHWAAKRDKPQLCASLLAQSADPFQRDSTNRTALDYAREGSSEETFSLLQGQVDQRRHQQPQQHVLAADALHHQGQPQDANRTL